MNRFFFFLWLFTGSVALSAQQEEIPLLKYEEAEQKIAAENDKLVVVNFWATTCGPCVKELPHFMEMNETFKAHTDFKMFLISLDRAKDIERVKKFIAEKNITAEVVILDDNKRMNTWIPRYDKDWMGEIPVTVFYYKGEKVHFHNGEMSREDLKNIIEKYIN